MRPNPSDPEQTVSVAIVATRLRSERLSSSSQALDLDDNQPSGRRRGALPHSAGKRDSAPGGSALLSLVQGGRLDLEL
jgi:hypothetical protein